MAYHHVREIDDRLAVLRDDQDGGSYAVGSPDGHRLVMARLDAPSWEDALLASTADDLRVAVDLHTAGQMGEAATLVMLRRIAGARNAGRRDGLAAGLARAATERRVAASSEFARLREETVRAVGCAPVQLATCPWLVGMTRRVGNRSSKAVFLFPFNLDRAAHAEVTTAMRDGLRMNVTGERDAVGNRRSHCWVVAPTATYGADPRHPSGVELRQDHWMTALRAAGLESDQEGNLVNREPAAEPAAAMRAI